MRIYRCPELVHEIGEGIFKVFILSAAEPVPLRDDAAAKDIVIRVEGRKAAALILGKKLFNHSVSLLIQIACDSLPVETHQPVRLPISGTVLTLQFPGFES